ncbi:MAG: hypothetical protein DWQ34_04390 [Planctomycetota bacterium]|nr:MAG: hypothetical protein DWQ34_04390 [Planctomycetota bacterium]
MTGSFQADGNLPVAGDGGMPVPVYDCHVILSAPNGEGTITARVSTLPEITASGRSERDVLRKIVEDFKAALVRYREAGEPIPWNESPAKPERGESQRWIPVHL